MFIKGTEGSICDMYGKRQKVIGEFVCDKIVTLAMTENGGYYIPEKEHCGYACMTMAEARKYGQGKPLYAWHISDLVMYDKPRALSEFTTPEWFRDCEKQCDDMERMRCPTKDSHKVDKMCGWCRKGGKPIKRPPQSWCYVEKGGE